MKEKLRSAARVVLTLAMVGVGITHFTNPDPFVQIVPSFLPAARALVYVSGVFEIALGLAIWPLATRRLASFGLVALYLAVFPANINMAVNEIQMNPAEPLPVWAMWARLPFQVLFIAWAIWVGRSPRPGSAAGPRGAATGGEPAAPSSPSAAR